MKFKGIVFLCLVTIIALLGMYGRGYWYPFYVQAAGVRTVSEVVHLYGPDAKSRLMPHFNRAGVTYPPEEVTFLATKDENLLEMWAKAEGSWKKIKDYKIKAASGGLGPKLREGDRQVPEGIYQIIGLNPNSSYHLSMKLNYPNSFDLKWAEKENRTEPGTNIFIHGKAVSIGCLAMGDVAIEELFILAHDVGISNVEVIISPTDPRENELVTPSGYGPWVEELYKNIEHKFDPFK